MSKNDAMGAAFVIPESAFKEIKKVDEKIANLAETSKASAKAFSDSFSTAGKDVSAILKRLDEQANNLGKDAGKEFSKGMNQALMDVVAKSATAAKSIKGMLEEAVSGLSGITVSVNAINVANATTTTNANPTQSEEVLAATQKANEKRKESNRKTAEDAKKAAEEEANAKKNASKDAEDASNKEATTRQRNIEAVKKEIIKLEKTRAELEVAMRTVPNGSMASADQNKAYQKLEESLKSVTTEIEKLQKAMDSAAASQRGFQTDILKNSTLFGVKEGAKSSLGNAGGLLSQMAKDEEESKSRFERMVANMARINRELYRVQRERQSIEAIGKNNDTLGISNVTTGVSTAISQLDVYRDRLLKAKNDQNALASNFETNRAFDYKPYIDAVSQRAKQASKVAEQSINDVTNASTKLEKELSRLEGARKKAEERNNRDNNLGISNSAINESIAKIDAAIVKIKELQRAKDTASKTTIASALGMASVARTSAGAAISVSTSRESAGNRERIAEAANTKTLEVALSKLYKTRQALATQEQEDAKHGVVNNSLKAQKSSVDSLISSLETLQKNVGSVNTRAITQAVQGISGVTRDAGGAIADSKTLIKDKKDENRQLERIAENREKILKKINALSALTDKAIPMAQKGYELGNNQALVEAMNQVEAYRAQLQGMLNDEAKLSSNREVKTAVNGSDIQAKTDALKSAMSAQKEWNAAQEKANISEASMLQKVNSELTRLYNLRGRINKESQQMGKFGLDPSDINQQAQAVTKEAEALKVLRDGLKAGTVSAKEIYEALQRVTEIRINANAIYSQSKNKRIEAQAQQGEQRTSMSVDDALSYAKAAQSLAQYRQALQSLKAVRETLNQGSSQGVQDTKAINAEMKRLSDNIKRVEDGAKNLRSSYSGLLNISQQLGRQLALMFSVSQIKQYALTIAKVRGEMELQQVSLRSILQDRTKADEIFNKTMNLAVQSPFRVGQLVTYTKQLAAYRIETDKLFETTKRLADVSAGLGIDMQRLILAYGQVKAAAYLRGCLAKGTMIKTKRGVIAVEDIVVGDTLYNERNEEVHVLELIRGREQMYDVIQEGAMTYRVNENHILTLINASDVEMTLQDKYVTEIIGHEDEWFGVTAQFNENDKRFYTQFRIEKAGIEDYYGFVLDGNKRFQLEDGTVTHNTEVRQFTEAGVNLYGELQRYFKDIKGEAYTTAQIVDMISKRKVTFEDIEEVFKRLTNQGGLFYDMQRIQSETLYGKMEKLKDQIYLMQNAIGQDNQGLISGLVDATAWLLKHWEPLISLTKALAAAIATLGLYSLQTGTKMKAMLTTSLAQDAVKAQGALKLLGVGFSKLGTVVSTFGHNLKMAVAANPILAALSAILYAFSKARSHYSELNKAIAEVSQRHDEEIVKLRKLTSKYEELAKKRKDAEEEQKKDPNYKYDFKLNEKQLKAEYEFIKEEYKNRGFEIPVDFQKPNKKNIDDAVKYFKEEIKNAIDFSEAANRAVVEDDHSWWMNARLPLFDIPIGPDSITEDLKDLQSAADGVEKWMGKAERAISFVGAKYDELSEKSKVAYDAIKDGPNEEEGELKANYLKRVQEALEAIQDADHKVGAVALGFTRENLGLSSLKQDIEGTMGLLFGLKRATDEVVAEFEGKLGGLVDAGYFKGKSEMTITAMLDTYAAEQKLTDYQKWALFEWAKTRFPFEFKAKKGQLDKELNWADEYIKDYFSKKKYGINVEVNDITDTTAIDQFLDGASAVESAVQKWKKAYDMTRTAPAFSGAKIKVTNQTRKLIEEVWGEDQASKKEIDGSKFREAVKKRYEEAEKDRHNMFGDSKEEKKNAEKHEKDIWQARISVLEKMQQRYNELRKYMGEKEAIAQTRKDFANAIKEAQIPDAVLNNMVPTAQGVSDALKTLLEEYKVPEATAKQIADAWSKQAEFKIRANTDSLKEDLDAAKKIVDDTMNSIELRTKLKDMGLNGLEIDKVFPELADLPRRIEDAIPSIQERLKVPEEFKHFTVADMLDTKKSASMREIMGKDEFDGYLKQMQEVDKKIQNERMNTIQQLVKDYKTQLNDQLKLDVWYADERKKIEETIQDEALANELRRNLDKERGKKDAELMWQTFQDSALYTTAFQNLEESSDGVLSVILKQLEDMGSNLNNLPVSKLRQMIKAQEEIKNQQAERHPYTGMNKDISTYIEYLKERAKWEAELIDLQAKMQIERDKQSFLGLTRNDQIAQREKIAQQLNRTVGDNVVDEKGNVLPQAEVDALRAQFEAINAEIGKTQGAIDASTSSLTSMQREADNLTIKLQQGADAGARLDVRLEKIKQSISLAGKVAEQFANIWDKKAARKINKAVQALEGLFDTVKASRKAIGQLNSIWKKTGKEGEKGAEQISKGASDGMKKMGETGDEVSIKSGQAAEAVVEGTKDAVVGTSTAAVTAIKMVESASVILAVISAALQVATAIANLFNDDEDKQEAIEEMQANVEELQWRYGKLKNAMGEAYNIESLQKYNKEVIKNLEAQAAQYREMAAMERSKKDSDEATARDYERQAEDIKDTIKELQETLTEELGGFGSEANYKAAAQAFADAWVDAFNEGSDTLDALTDKMDEYFNNLVKKQVMMKATEKFLTPVFEKIDAIVDKGSRGGNLGYEIDRQEVAEVQELMDKQAKEYNDFVLAWMDALGISPNSATLSALQQGIQSVTEETAQALESLLNSIRFYVANQSSDVHSILEHLQEQSSAGSSPILDELQKQTDHLNAIKSMFENTLVTSANGGAKGLKVFVANL